MSPLIFLLTLLNNGWATANPTAAAEAISAFRRRAAGRRRPRMSASAAYETWTRARIEGPNFERFADFAGACMRGHDACRPPSDQAPRASSHVTLRFLRKLFCVVRVMFCVVRVVRVPRRPASSA